MPIMFALPRHRGHRETPVLVAMVLVLCVAGNGVLMILRDANRAQKAHLSLHFADRLGSFGHGAAWGMLLFFGLLVALVAWGLVAFWFDNWRWNRIKTREDRD